LKKPPLNNYLQNKYKKSHLVNIGNIKVDEKQLKLKALNSLNNATQMSQKKLYKQNGVDSILVSQA
jgi:hypothetical protein